MNLLVLGGAGYIGSHVVKMIVQENRHQVVVYDNLSKGFPQAVEAIAGKSGREIPLEEGDIGDSQNVLRVLKKYRIDGVMNFAALIEVGTSLVEPAAYYQNNFVKVFQLLEAVRAAGVRYFLFSSTAAVFGNASSGEKLREESPLAPINPYGWSKLMVEQMLRDYGQAYGLRSAILRYFNACGSDEEGWIGQSYEPASHLIAKLMKGAGSGEGFTFQLYGDDWETRDGSCVRDFIHVNDVARVHLLALEKMCREDVSVLYNLGSGKGYSVKEVIAAAREVLGRDFPVEVAARREGDPAELIADNTKVCRELGWRPSRDLYDILHTAWNWQQNKTY